MTMERIFSDQEQFQCLNLLDFLSSLFTCAGKESFTKTDILVVLNNVKNDVELFDPAIVIAQEATVQFIESQHESSEGAQGGQGV
jgi:hypothetical protein